MSVPHTPQVPLPKDSPACLLLVPSVSGHSSVALSEPELCYMKVCISLIEQQQTTFAFPVVWQEPGGKARTVSLPAEDGQLAGRCQDSWPPH